MKYLKSLKKYFVKFSKLTVRFLKKCLRLSCLVAIGIFLLYPLGLPTPEGIHRDYAEFPNGVDNFTIPFESFVYITVQSTSYINPQENMTASASGIVIRTLNTEKTYILTAGHACEPLMVLFGSNMGLGDTFQSNTTVEVYDYFGFKHEAEILGIDFDSDLCLLESNDVWNDGIPISRAMPKSGERVYSIAAPRSIFSPGNALLFDGYYTGLDQSMDAYFTIPARPGSSGAGIINKHGHIVGIIHSAAVELENLAIASSVYDIDAFLSSYIIYVSAY